MTARQIKWLILIIPTLTIGLWEYARHEFLLPFISMEVGNWLAPLIVLFVTMTFLLKLFSILEQIQEELNLERGAKAVLEERERIAKELHDGITQSLFLLSIKVDQLVKRPSEPELQERYSGLQKTVHQVNDYVRQAITSLRDPAETVSIPWLESVRALAKQFEAETGVRVVFSWSLDEEALGSKEKVELYACLREALINVRKHAQAGRVSMACTGERDNWTCIVEDDGHGFDPDAMQNGHRFGIKIMRERAEQMGWRLELKREADTTRLSIRKGEAE